MIDLNVSMRRRQSVAMAALLMASLSLTGCAVLRPGLHNQTNCADGACAARPMSLEATGEAPATLEPLDIVEYQENGCGAPVGCAPLMTAPVAVPPEASWDAPEATGAYESVEQIHPVPDTITSSSDMLPQTAPPETAIPLTIPPSPSRHPQIPHAQHRQSTVEKTQRQNPEVQNPQYQSPHYDSAQYDPAPAQYPGARMSSGPAPIAQCAPCQECVRLQYDTVELRDNVSGLQQTLESERELRAALEESLSVLRKNVSRISDDVRYWQNEVRRIDEEAEQQHKEDLQSLEMLSELVSQFPRQEKLPDVDVSIIEE